MARLQPYFSKRHGCKRTDELRRQTHQAHQVCLGPSHRFARSFQTIGLHYHRYVIFQIISVSVLSLQNWHPLEDFAPAFP